MRFCVHCQKEIPLPVLIRGRWKSIFCSADCRFADRNAIRNAKKEHKRQMGLCPTCGRKRSNAREHVTVNAISQTVEAAS